MGTIVVHTSIVSDQSSFDPEKDRRNRTKHGLAFSDFKGFDQDPAVIEDDRADYGERRFRALGRIDGQGHCVILTYRDGRMRLISFRRAHEKELRRHGQ